MLFCEIIIITIILLLLPDKNSYNNKEHLLINSLVFFFNDINNNFVLCSFLQLIAFKKSRYFFVIDGNKKQSTDRQQQQQNAPCLIYHTKLFHVVVRKNIRLSVTSTTYVVTVCNATCLLLTFFSCEIDVVLGPHKRNFLSRCRVEGLTCILFPRPTIFLIYK